MKHAMRYFLWMAIVGGLFVAGCEERVVGTRNDWVGSQLNRVQPVAEKPDATDTFLDDTGELLFGWTREITGKKKPTPNRPAVRDVPLEDRIDR